MRPPCAVVPLSQAELAPVDISVSQTTGNYFGTTVEVTATPAGSFLFDRRARSTLVVTDSAPMAPQSVRLFLPPGDWTLRAFRDADGDGLPTILSGTPGDAQAAAVVPVGVGGASATLVLDTPTLAGTYTGLDAYAATHRNSQDAPGCGGFHVEATAVVQGSAAELDLPQVRGPRGYAVLVDDGDCDRGGLGVSGSFDNRQGDGRLTAGFADAADIDSGEYLFAWRNSVHDMIHMQRDTIASPLIRFPLFTPLALPDGARPSATTAPHLEWAAVPGADAYQLAWTPVAELSTWVGTTTRDTFLDPAGLLDGTAYRFDLQPLAYHAGVVGNLEARGYAAQGNAFIIDTSGSRTVTFSGAIRNHTVLSGRVFVFARGCQRQGGGDPADCGYDPQATTTLSMGALSYSVAVLRTSVVGRGSVEAYLEVPGGDPGGNNQVQARRAALDGTLGATDVDLDLWKIPVLYDPPEGERGTGDAPHFTWENYLLTPGEAPPVFSLVFFAEAVTPSGGFPAIAWGLPADATEWPGAPNAVDVRLLATTQPSEADLSSATSWRWGVVMLECAFGDLAYDACVTTAIADDGPTVVATHSLFTQN
ncbi:MAG: hypothetical protein HY904_19675 [Deltaproteobacteria bacterium]|nr:hypothetical protein [Deltaproteobacteria bacterium]